MKRPVVVIVGLAAGALLVAGAGASAHTLSLVRDLGTQGASTFSHEASGARLESPEPEESPQATPTAEPTERPEPAENEQENEQENENEDEDNDADEDGNEAEHHDGGDDDDGEGDD